MKAYGCQIDIAWENKPANYARVRELLSTHQPAPGSLVVLPEMFATGFTMNVAAAGEEPGGPTEQFVAGIAKEFGIHVIAGIVARTGEGRGRNEAVAFEPDGRLLARYCKMQPFSPGGENRHYVPGAAPVLFDWQGCRVAPLVCYDLRFPELFRSAVVQGAQCYAVIANWPAPRIEHWVQLLRARAIENQAYVVGVNRCGRDPNLVYPGRSLIISPRGEVLVDAGAEEGLVGAEIELGAVADYRREFPVLADIRREFVR